MIIEGLPISNKKGYLICPKEKCGKRGHISKHIREDKVRIPNKKNIDTIVKAFDYNARLFYRFYDYLSYLPFEDKFESKFNIGLYHEFVPFSPHSIEETREFEEQFTKILSEKFEIYNRSLPTPNDNSIINSIDEYNERSLNKIKRAMDKKTKKNVLRSSIASLYYSISFSALRDIYKEMKKGALYASSDKNSIDKFNGLDKRNSKCIIFFNSFIESLIDGRYHIPFDKGLKLIEDSLEFGPYSAATRNSSNWLICKKCFENKHLSLFENGKCPRCNTSRKYVSKVDPKTIKTKKQEIVDNFRDYRLNYLSFLGFMSELTEQVRNNDYIKSIYLSNFRRYKEQIINSEYSYLKESRYGMFHYDPSVTSKKKKNMHSLTENDILNIAIKDDDYQQTVIDGIKKRDASFTIEKMIEVLSKYNYPKEFAEQKAFNDIKKAFGLIYFKDNPTLRTIFNALTPNKIEDFIGL